MIFFIAKCAAACALLYYGFMFLGATHNLKKKGQHDHAGCGAIIGWLLWTLGIPLLIHCVLVANAKWGAF